MRACPRCLTVFDSAPAHCRFDGARLESFDHRDPLEGRHLRNFRLEALVGTGGTGVVYCATNDSSHERCAVKLVFGERVRDAKTAERFERAASALKKLDHPHVARMIDCGLTDVGMPFVVTEFLEGRSLREVILTDTPMDPVWVGRLAQQLTSGLSAIHGMGYVHQDLKPGNVMVAARKHEPEFAKILDVGLVAALRAREAPHRLADAAQPGSILGTPIYMAPEQVDPEAVTPAADLYAAGVILYELLTGKAPFIGSTEQIIVAKMLEPAPALPAWTGELRHVVERLLATKAQKRPPSAAHAEMLLEDVCEPSKFPTTPELPHHASVGFQEQSTGTAPWAPKTRPIFFRAPEPSPGFVADAVATLPPDAPPRPHPHRPALLVDQDTEDEPDVDDDLGIGPTRRIFDSTPARNPGTEGADDPVAPLAAATLPRSPGTAVEGWMLVLLFFALLLVTATLAYAYFGTESAVVVDALEEQAVNP